jgi:Flp pilus assembly protein TadB
VNIIHVWVAVSLVGLALSMYLSAESIRDLMALPNKTNGRRTVARSRLLRESMRVSVHLAYLVLGVSAWGSNPGLSFSIVALMWGNVAMLVNSLVDARTRRVLAQPRDDLGRFVKED